MSSIELKTYVEAPIDRVFDLCRNVDVHVHSTSKSQEVAVDGVTTGCLNLGDRVTWEATHFFKRRKLSVEITKFDRPNYFQDSMIEGIFKHLRHDHFFKTDEKGTIVTDVFDYQSPFGFLGALMSKLILDRYFQKFLSIRANVIKNIAETQLWKKYLIDDAEISNQ